MRPEKLHLKKPAQLTDFFIRQTAKKTRISESVVELIVKDQWKHANLASRDLQEIEIVGLGTFYPSIRKAAYRYIKLFNKYHNILNIQNNTDSRTNATLNDIRENLIALTKIKDYDKIKEYMARQAPHIVCNKEFGIS